MDAHNFSALCGTVHLDIWDPNTHSISLCFQKLFIMTPVFALLAVVSAFYIGSQSDYVLRSRKQLIVLYSRVALVVAMIVFSILLEPLLLFFVANARIYWADVVSFGVQGLSWTVHLIYLATLKVRRIGSTVRGSKLVMFAWSLTVIASVIFTHTCYSKASLHWTRPYFVVMRALSVSHLTLQMLYCLTVMLPTDGNDSTSGYREFQHDRLLEQQAAASASNSGQYTRFHEVAAPFYLGTAEANITKLSYLTFHWVNGLLEKGSVGLLKGIDDLHLLPQDLRTQQVSYTVRRHLLMAQPLPADDRDESGVQSSAASSAASTDLNDCSSDYVPRVVIKAGRSSSADASGVRSKFSLFWALHGVFGVQFYSIGVLKLVSDACSFAGPLLLHELVTYVDHKDSKAWKGYVYSLCLCLAAFISSLSSVHFDYYLARLNIKLRAAVITTVYRKIQHLNTAQRSQFSSGQIINLMSTDADRVLNFGQSFHSCWSLPLKLCITLYLLYMQIGLAFLAGLGVIVVVSYLTWLLAKQIGTLSQRMMSFKDARVSLMTELLSMIKSVKLNTWEELFIKRINEQRTGELKALAGRKYLDAGCVYFWAATPVFIPVIAFGVYVWLGNEMEAARVFTAVALFNMLVMPLNAFPWAINGLVEAFISYKRIEKIMQEDEQDLSQYYTIVADMSTNNSELQLLINEATFSWEVRKGMETGLDAVEDCHDDSEMYDDDEECYLEVPPSEYDEEDGYGSTPHSRVGDTPAVGSAASASGKHVMSSIKKSVSRSMKTKKLFSKQDSDEEELVADEDIEEDEIVNSSDAIDDDDDGLNIIPTNAQHNRRDRYEEWHRRHTRRSRPSDTVKTIRNINLQVAKGEVVAIIGKTGSGKSTLINAILAELTKLDGIVAVAALHHGFGYSAQDPWIQDLTIKENILFGSDFDVVRYNGVIHACALDEDIKKLPKGDETRCGENGQCLSGGQKSRLSLARAIYQQKGMYILDSPLSSVDGPVARHIMKEVIFNFLKGKTVILTTHHVHLTTRCSTIVHMDRGRITHVGSPDDVLVNFLSPQELVRDWWYDLPGGSNNNWSSTGAVPRSNTLPRHKGKGTLDEHSSFGRLASSKSSVDVKTQDGRRPSTADDSEGLLLMEEHEKYALINVQDDEDPPLQPEALLSSTDREYLEVGSLSWSVYNTYISAIGYALALCTLLSLMGMQFSRNLTDLWLAYWVSNVPGHSNMSEALLTSSVDQRSYIARPVMDSTAHEEHLNAMRVASFGSWMVHPPIHRHSITRPYSWVTSLNTLVLVPNDWKAEVTSSTSGGWFSSPSSETFLMIYCIIAAAHSIFTILRAFGFAYCGVKAAKNLHDKLLRSILNSSMIFFDENPIGRILNRFSTDLYTVDDSLPFMFNIFLAQSFGLIGSIILTIYGLPWMILMYIPVGMIYYTVQHYYRYTSRDVRRIYALSLSPMYAHFTQVLDGLPTIRAMRSVNSFSSDCERLIECNQRAQLSMQAISQWLNLRLQLLGVMILAGVCLLAVLQHHTLAIDPGMVGLVITYALTINGFLNSVVTSFTETEREFISVERLTQYITGPPRDGQQHRGRAASGIGHYGGVGGEFLEDSITSVDSPEDSLSPRSDWPQHNTIRFEDVYVKYNFHNPCALKRINLRIGANEKIGILGRTGAGKSTLFSVLFRLVEPSRGTIFIDNVDITCLPLKRLRSAIAIVPQSAPLFSGTVRQNLDPFNEHTDQAIWSALQACHADSIVLAAARRAQQAKKIKEESTNEAGKASQKDKSSASVRPNKSNVTAASSSLASGTNDSDFTKEQCLANDMGEVGRNLSQGERQLMVLARAILTRAKIVCVDEGTAQLDPATESLVQRALRDAFRNTTLLIIAHRIRTLSFCDRLVVLEEGQVVEEGSPHELMVKTDSRYSELLRRQ